MAAAVLYELGRGAEIAARLQEPAAATVAAMLQRHFNSPLTSSMGRVFDAAVGLLGICTHQHYEAHAAILLEQAALCHIEVNGWPKPLRSGWIIDDKHQLDLLPFLAQLDRSGDVNQAAACFHATLVASLVDWVMQATQVTGLNTVACGGGCFLNTLLSLELKQQLQQRGIQVLIPVRTSPGDASIALGQSWVAMNKTQLA
jgi:hydrogenase maturation protein HypF